MHYLGTLAAVTAVLVSSTSATCFGSGAPFGSKALAEETLKDACHEVDGTYDAGEVYSVCRNTPVQKIIFEVNNQNKNAVFLSYDACVANLRRQIVNCYYGGYETFGGVWFK